MNSSENSMASSPDSRGGASRPGKPLLGPRGWGLAAGIAGALTMVGVYILILTLAESFSHAVEQLSRDGLWVALVAAGFGTQLGLYTYLRATVRRARTLGATAMTGVGTGTSTAGMVACCAHHVADIAPLIGLSGAAAVLGAYRVPFIIIGLGFNLVGIALSLRTLGRIGGNHR